MGSIVSHIYDMERLYGSWENYLTETSGEKEGVNKADRLNTEKSLRNENGVIFPKPHDYLMERLGISIANE